MPDSEDQSSPGQEKAATQPSPASDGKGLNLSLKPGGKESSKPPRVPSGKGLKGLSHGVGCGGGGLKGHSHEMFRALLWQSSIDQDQVKSR